MQFVYQLIFILLNTAIHYGSHFIEKCQIFRSTGIIEYHFLEMSPKKMSVFTINE